MNRPLRLSLLLLAVLAGCATSGGAPSTGATGERKLNPRFKQADQRFPPELRAFDDAIEQSFAGNIINRLKVAQMATESNNMDQARSEYAAAGAAAAEFADKFPSSDWRISFRYNAAKLFWYGNKFQETVEQAAKVELDPEASDGSRALALKLEHAALTVVAGQKAQAGQLEPLRLLRAEQRKGAPPNPRPPPGEWGLVVKAADAYIALSAKDPDASKDPKDRLVSSTPAQIALSAAQVEYGFDDFEDARARFERVVLRWPEVVDSVRPAVALYLDTFIILKDDAGLATAVPRLREQVAAAAAKTTDPKVKENLGKVLELFATVEEETALKQAVMQLNAGKYAEAAAAYDAFIAAHPASPNLTNAMLNASVAQEKLGNYDKAVALREALLAKDPDSKDAPKLALSLAALRGKQDKKDQAVKLYQAFLEKYPDSPDRCTAILNMAVAQDQLRKELDAAASYLRYGGDAQCAKEDANNTTKLLYRAAELFDKGGKRADAKKAYQTCAAVPGVTDVVAKSNQAEASKRAKR
jgi:tetratricopeptide (TPR) repeat protein